MIVDILHKLIVSEARKYSKRAALTTIAITTSLNNFAQSQTNDASSALVNEGYENVKTFQRQDTLYATFESQNHRGSYRMIGNALKTLAKVSPQTRVFKTLILEYNKPQIAIIVEKEENSWKVGVDYDTNSIEQQIPSAEQQHSSSLNKLDIVLYPILSIDNHLLDKLAEVAFFVAPSLEMTFWKGNRTFFQPIIPIAHNLRRGNSDRNFQLGIVGIRQDWIANKHWAISSTLGTFLYNRYGIHTDIAYHCNHNLDLGMRIAVTGEQTLTSEKWLTTAPKKVQLMANANYYDAQTSLQGKLSVGTFVFGDLGARADIIRHFGEFAIGVYAIYTDGEKNAGFNFALPLSTRRQMRKSLVRVRFPQYFSWEYSMLNFYRYADESMGRDIKVRPDKSFTTHYWQASYIKQYLQRYLDGIIR